MLFNTIPALYPISAILVIFHTPRQTSEMSELSYLIVFETPGLRITDRKPRTCGLTQAFVYSKMSKMRSDGIALKELPLCSTS